MGPEEIEPSLGWAANGQIGNTEDLEPSLGWSEQIRQDSGRRFVSTDDREAEHNGREADMEEDCRGFPVPDETECWYLMGRPPAGYLGSFDQRLEGC